MSLITCKKIRGRGNSLKFRVKSEEVRVFSLSFILSVTLLFGVSGAWANTYLSESRELDNDWTLNDTLSIAYGTSQSDTIVLDVGTWYLTINGNLIVGHNRLGTLNLGTGKVSVIPASNNVGTYIGNDGTAVGVVNVDGGTFTAGGVKPFYVGQTGEGTLNLNSGSVVSTNEVYIGNNAGGVGVVNVIGGHFDARKHLCVGVNGTGTLNLNGGTVDVANDLNVGEDSGSGTINGISGDLHQNGSGFVFNVGKGANSTGTVIKEGGDWSCYYLRLGTGTGSTGSFTHNDGTLEVKTELSIGSKCTGTFTMNGGTVTLNWRANQFIGKDSGSSGTLNLNGGTLTARCLRRNNDGATATLNFNGGTLKSNYADTRGLIASGVTTTVLAGGGTIDSGNISISVASALSGTGAMRFKGGNTITLSGANTYTGGTIIELGTKVVASHATAKDTILSNLVIDGRAVLAGGEYDVLVASGLTAADLEKVSLVNCAAGSTVGFDNDETPTKIVVTLAEPICLTTSYSLVFPGKTLDDIKEADFTCRFCGASAPNCIQLDSGKGYNKKLYFNSNGILTDIYVEMQVADGNFVKCVVVQFQNSDDGVKGRIFGSDAKYVSSQSLGYVFLEPDTTTWHGSNQSIATTRTGSGYGICDLRVTAAAATVEWTLDADKNWSDFSGYDALGADAFVRITATGDYTLTMDADISVGKIEFMGASGSTMIVSSGKTVTTEGVSGISNILNNGIIVKTGDETAYMPFNNASEGVTVINCGTMKIASHTGDGSSHTVRVKSGATFDMNGWGDTVVNVILEEGANFVNSRGNIPNNMRQTKSVTLEGDAMATASKNFGLIGSGHAETTLALGSNTLTINGTSSFWLCNTTIVGDGIIAVNGGTVQCVYSKLGNVIGENCTLNIGEGGTLRIDNDVFLTVKNFYNRGTYYVYSNYGLGMLEVTGALTTGNQVTKLTLADGATVKATGTAQVVSTTFAASGAITIDALEITAAVLREAGESGVDVLTVPANFDYSSVTWNVTNTAVNSVRAKWRINEGGETKTLYIARSSGLTVIIR